MRETRESRSVAPSCVLASKAEISIVQLTATSKASEAALGALAGGAATGGKGGNFGAVLGDGGGE